MDFTTQWIYGYVISKKFPLSGLSMKQLEEIRAKAKEELTAEKYQEIFGE